MNDTKKKRLTIDVPYKLHRTFKLKCVREELDMKIVMIQAITAFVQPNPPKGEK
jgi:hypothetical protein